MTNLHAQDLSIYKQAGNVTYSSTTPLRVNGDVLISESVTNYGKVWQRLANRFTNPNIGTLYHVDLSLNGRSVSRVGELSCDVVSYDAGDVATVLHSFSLSFPNDIDLYRHTSFNIFITADIANNGGEILCTGSDSGIAITDASISWTALPPLQFGQNAATGNVDFGGFKAINSSPSTTPTGLTTLGQVTDSIQAKFDLVTPVILSAEATLDFPNTTDGNSSSLTITVTGAEPGDVVVVGSVFSTVANTTITTRVSATDTVLITFSNNSGADSNLGPGLYKVKVFK